MKGIPLKLSKDSSYLFKLFMGIFLPMAVLIVCATIIFFYTQVSSEKTIIETHETNHVDMAKRVIFSEFDSVVSDLMILADDKHLRDFLATGDSACLIGLSEDFFAFSERKKLYDQIRFLDETGRETVRVNFNNSNSFIVPENQLQNKGKRYYFMDTFQLEPGEVFVSPFDLNIEHGEIEQPLKPMIRFGTPVSDDKGRKRGIILVNYLGAKLINDMEKMTSGALARIMLVNSDGFYLKGPRPEDEWGFMYEDGISRTLGNALPDAWEKISGSESGQFYSPEGMFTFFTVYPVNEAWRSSTGSCEAFAPSDVRLSGKEYHWKIVSLLPPELIIPESRKVQKKLFVLDMFLLVLLAAGSWVLAGTKLRRRQTEEEIKQARDFLEAVIESVRDGVVIVNEKAEIRAVNSALVGMSRFSKEELIGEHISRLTIEDKELRGKILQKVGELFEKGHAKYESVHQGRGGKIINVECNTSMISDKEGNYIAGVSVIRDITERKLFHEKLMKAQKIEATGILAGGVAHDFNNLLSVILGNISMAKDGIKDGQVLELLNDAEKASKAARDLTKKFISFSTGGMPIRKKTSVKEMIEGRVELTLSCSNVKCEYMFPDDLWKVEIDSEQTGQAIQEVLENAIESMPHGGVIRIAAENFTKHGQTKEAGISIQDGKYVRICISDSGMGIHKDDLPKIFDPYFSTKQRGVQKGMGLGLSTSYGIIKKHDGDMFVKSVPEKGTDVYIFLPAV